ncbi:MULTISPECIES: RIP metalloprotease RseP [unclassified Lactococcus]|uniref:RIP metalloprotease RseP n=1 Tax=unclassified Lactococcus TaxID=2643510 RepID=UPI0011CCAF84|nr:MULTISPECIES: RIP metalloprotease RseP [unclassified Lactococcus]MQW23595.1 RIP metalloprotease RseP [Lactococcus sp. dk101]TXK37717.1 RIP metalloprotease RseP [Lactococcus sp. dk310]TXK49199.1 RIP metalloprotease RseP [Lactococcus sp. dk322]
MIETLITFIIVFGVIVVVHEYGHLWWAKRAGILVREFSVGMGPKTFAHQAKDGTFYTIRILPIGGYVRMAGWGEDKTEIKKGQPAALVVSTDSENLVTRINLSDRVELDNAVPILVTDYDFEQDLYIEGEVFGEMKRFAVDHDATIIEEDGTEVRIAPLDVQYQSASIIGKILTNFAGPLNNFILGLIAFIVVVFMQGGVANQANIIGSVEKGTPAYSAGLRANDKIMAVNGQKTATWSDAVTEIQSSEGKTLDLTIEQAGTEKEVKVTPKKVDGTYLIGIRQSLKTGFWDKITGGFEQTAYMFTAIGRALSQLISRPSLNDLGGPVAIYQMSGQAAKGGIITVISFLGMLSINLGLVNLMPIPVLDGGKILLNLIEAVRRKPLSQEKESIITMIGAVFMIVLFIAVMWNDIMRAFIR